MLKITPQLATRGAESAVYDCLVVHVMSMAVAALQYVFAPAFIDDLHVAVWKQPDTVAMNWSLRRCAQATVPAASYRLRHDVRS